MFYPQNLCDLIVVSKSGFTSKLFSEPTTEIPIQYISSNESVFLRSFPGDSDAAGLSLEPGRLGMQSGSLVLDSLGGV